MKKLWSQWKWLPMVVAGCAIFSLGFDLFLEPHDTNCGGLSGLAQVCAAWSRTGTVGLWTAIMNIPLFIIGAKPLESGFLWLPGGDAFHGRVSGPVCGHSCAPD